MKGGERGKRKGERREGKGGRGRRGLCSCKNSLNMPRVVWSLNCLHVVVCVALRCPGELTKDLTLAKD